MSHDPSRRLFLGGLPPEVTRKEIVEFIKKRTRANPMYIEIAKGADGKGKGYAHATVEGLRSVIEALNGVPMNGNRITAAQAKPHFSVPILAVKAAREKAEQDERDRLYEQRQAQKETKRERDAELKRLAKSVLEADDEDDDDDPYAGVKKHRAGDAEGVPSATTFAGSKSKYATVAAEIAAASREKHHAMAAPPQDDYHHGHSGSYQQQHQYGGARGGGGRGGGGQWHGGGRGGGGPQDRWGGDGRDSHGGKRVSFGGAEAPAPQQPAAPPPPPPPPEPTKEAKKLASLQAKLAALKQKLGK